MSNQATASVKVTHVEEQIVEIVSDSGEGAQKAGTAFAALNAKMGNGVWTVEIIPAEVKPPARSTAGASGIRVRFGQEHMTNMGDQADLVMAFNEQVLYGRINQEAYRPGTVILLENKWKDSNNDKIKAQYAKALVDFADRGFVVKEMPLEEACLAHTKNPKLGKNMFILGMLVWIYDRKLETALEEIDHLFGRKGETVVESNQKLCRAGYAYAMETLDFRFSIEAKARAKELVVMNGNEAVGLGIMASGMDLLSMYPITPATSVSHYLGDALGKVGGFLHQAEDEIAAVGFAIGSSYAGRTACTVTSGPGMALKTEFMGLAVMSEVPLVMVVVQRGGPSTGLPTKVEQGDLLAAIFGAPGDAPKLVIAPATIEECFTFIPRARQMAEEFRGLVVVLTDANLATGVQPFPRPEVKPEQFNIPFEQGEWEAGKPPYDWDEKTGMSPRPIPGQVGGEYVLTGLAHTNFSKVAYDPSTNQTSSEMRSRKFAAFRDNLPTPKVHGAEDGDLLIVGWGSTLGSIVEAVDRARSEGKKVSTLHLRDLNPLPRGLEDIFKRFKQVMTVEINYSDPVELGEDRRYAQLAWWLRANTLVDIDCWSNVFGQPIRPGLIYDEIVRRLSEGGLR
ncbi:MAG: 2-oxoacid:acceptor oxidoreductase subunit alpha [Deltaproteobacteria bacterium]|nr:2-oxoacid:acceptor oxidoreductase subunit alpha [Deltaproteobacteria bacterium]